MQGVYGEETPSNEDLNYYFSNYVSVTREDSKRSYELAEKYIKKLLEEINKNDIRFDKEPVKVNHCKYRLKARSHIYATQLSSPILDRGLQQQSGGFLRLIRRVVDLELFKINNPIVGTPMGKYTPFP